VLRTSAQVCLSLDAWVFTIEHECAGSRVQGATQKRITLLILTNLMHTAWMLLRTYSVWRCYRDLKYTQLPKKDTISNFTGAHFDSIYILKRTLGGWNGVFVVGGIWMCSILALGYLFRTHFILAADALCHGR
jgi:hypothetical protein